MKTYNFKKARKILKHFKEKGLVNVGLGMHEDFWWTGMTWWRNGKFRRKLKELWPHSPWATPCIWLTFKKGKNRAFDCSKGKATNVGFAAGLGCLSKPVQNQIPDLEIFEEMKK